MVTGRGNYILISDRDRFVKAKMREARLYTDHRMVLSVLRGEGALKNRRYVVGRMLWPLAAPTVRMQMEGETAFECLKGEVERKQQTTAVRAEWIYKETWQLEYCRSAPQRAGRASTREVRKARRDFQHTLQEDRRQRVQAAGSNIEIFLEDVRVKEAW